MREKVLELVKNAVRELNEELEYDSLRDPSEDTSVFGGDDGIDSLSLVSLIVGLEREIGAVFGKPVMLADEKAMSMRNSPYRTVGSLADLVVGKLEQA